VNRIRRSPSSIRLLLAALLALWLGVRLLTPAGFMPSFAHGSLAIVECPEADGTPPARAMPDMPGMVMAGMATAGTEHHDGKNGFHQLCPYAQAASLAGIDPEAVVLALPLLLSAMPRPARTLPVLARHATRDRPPARGPPLPA
jgi:hypothetical protein